MQDHESMNKIYLVETETIQAVVVAFDQDMAKRMVLEPKNKSKPTITYLGDADYEVLAKVIMRKD